MLGRRADWVQGVMSYASTNFPTSTKFPAHSVDLGRAPPRVPMERRQQRLPRILLLPLDDIPSENLRRLLARYYHGPSSECRPRGTLHTDNMVLITAFRHCVGPGRR